MKQQITAATLIVSVVFLAGYAFFVTAVTPFAKRDAQAKAAFDPIVELRPAIFDNAFGVYVVEFDEASALSDSTVHQILALNRLPAEYDLTLVIKTASMTDASVPALSQLTSPDTIVLDGTGLTDAGIADLQASLPNGTLSRRTGLDTNRRSENDW